MTESNMSHDVPGPDGAAIPLAPSEEAGASALAWEMVQPGRYMPRRIRGSYLGRELG
jgi:hypothetical protein